MNKKQHLPSQISLPWRLGLLSGLTILVSLQFQSPALADQAAKKKSKKTVGQLLTDINKSKSKFKPGEMNKSQSKLPAFQQSTLDKNASNVNLRAVKPPSSQKLYFEEGTDEAELERVIDKAIAQLYKLSEQNKRSSSRGEIWLRLAETYSDKSRLVEYRIQSDYDKKLALYQAKKIQNKPVLNVEPAKEYNKKAVQLYEWFLRDFPKDDKVDQALFFLGFNYFEMGQEDKGQKAYFQLTNEHPKSPYIVEANFSLGEYHFNREEWKKALEYYQRVAKIRRSRLYTFAYYKMAWSKYKIGQTTEALKDLERVIRVSRGEEGEKGGVSRVRLASEAIKDLIPFYAEAGDYKVAYDYFERMVGKKKAYDMLEKLSYYYSGMGNRTAARHNFQSLIQMNPVAPKAFDYQYQIVQMYLAEGQKDTFREELYNWITAYGAESEWGQANKKNPELVNSSLQLMETTLRNHTLQLHQTAQASRAPYSQKLTNNAYELYLKSFPNSKMADEMYFFYGELLYDMSEYDRAAQQYLVVAEQFPKSKYKEKAVLNALLAQERKLPSDKEIRKNVGDTVDEVPFDKPVEDFIKVAEKYYSTFPKGEKIVDIKYRVATLHYAYNHFDSALVLFQEIVKNHPKTKYAEFSANLILDIYNLKKDYAGLKKAGEELLANSAIADTQAGSQVKGIIEKSSFKLAQELEGQKKFLESAKMYQDFAKANPKSDLVAAAQYNAAVNFERGQDLAGAATMYALVLNNNSKQADSLKDKARRNVVNIYQQTGQYLKAAYEFERIANANPKDKSVVDYYFNAAVIFDGLNMYNEARRNYEQYFDKSRKGDRIETQLLLAEMYRRRNIPSKALDYYEKYYYSNPSSPEQVVRTAYLIAKMNERLGRGPKADEWYRRTIAVQKKLSGEKPIGARYAAEARFKQVMLTFNEFRAMRIPNDPAKQPKVVQNKLALLTRINNEMATVIKYDDGPWIVAALVTIGEAYQDMGESLYKAPAPRDLKPDELKQYKEGIDQVARPLIQKAQENYNLALDRSSELESYNSFVFKANRGLQNMDLTKSRGVGEIVNLLEVVDSEVKGSSDELKALSLAYKEKNEERLVANASKILTADPNNAEALNALAAYYIEEKKPGLARIIIKRGLEKSPDHPGLNNNLGVIEAQDDELRSAIAQFKKGLKSPYASINLASIYGHHLDYKNCMNVAEDAFDFAEDNKDKMRKVFVEVGANYGVCARGSGDTSKAQKIYKQVLDVESRHLATMMNYAILLVEFMKEKKESASLLSKIKFVAEDKNILNKVESLENILDKMESP